MNEIKCPRCTSSNIHADKKGFSTAKAFIWTVIENPVIGALAGTLGSNKIILTCLNCGHTFNPGEQLKIKSVQERLPKGVNVNNSSISYNITCSYCGKESSTSFTNCPKCGRQFTLEETQSAKNTALKRKTSSGCLGVLFIVFIISIFIKLL